MPRFPKGSPHCCYVVPRTRCGKWQPPAKPIISGGKVPDVLAVPTLTASGGLYDWPALVVW